MPVRNVVKTQEKISSWEKTKVKKNLGKYQPIQDGGAGPRISPKVVGFFPRSWDFSPGILGLGNLPLPNFGILLRRKSLW